MSNEVATQNNSAALATADAYDPYLTHGEELGGNAGAAFLKYNGNDGGYTFGSDAEELVTGSKVAIVAESFGRGWICWKGGDVQEEIIVPILTGLPPKKDELTDHGPYAKGDGWIEQVVVRMKDLDTGIDLLYKPVSKGGKGALGRLMTSYGKQRKMNMDDNGNFLVPIAEIGERSFTPKDIKTKKWAPSFEIVEWMSADELTDLFAGTQGDDEVEEEVAEAKPKRKPLQRRSKKTAYED